MPGYPIAVYASPEGPRLVSVGGWDGEAYYLPELRLYARPEALSDPGPQPQTRELARAA
jgi:hypothetical protein